MDLILSNYCVNLTDLSTKIGTTEPALRILLSIFYGYIISVIYLFLIRNLSLVLRKFYVIFCGMFILYFNYGIDCGHCLITILIQWCIMKTLFRNRSTMILISFLWNMGYLFFGYMKTSTTNYDITWTMPQCVLVLRLIGISIDLADGQAKNVEPGKERNERAINNVPNVIDMLGFAVFPTACLVGPQFTFHQYSKFIENEFPSNWTNIKCGFSRCMLGICYLLVYQIGNHFIGGDELMLSNYYSTVSLWIRLVLLSMWAHLSLYKYLCCWLLTEGATTLIGLSWAGSNKWTSCQNIRVIRFETAEKFQHYVDSFNVNTNAWIAYYIYKRLKFIGNRYISHAVALIFLALWHGFHSGYYLCFFMEFIVINWEREMESTLLSQPSLLNISNAGFGGILKTIFFKVYAFVGMGWCLVPFVYLQWEKYMKVYADLYYFGFWIFIPFPIWKYILKIILRCLFEKNRDGKEFNNSQKRIATLVELTPEQLRLEKIKES